MPRQITLTHETSAQIDFEYDFRGRRIKKTVTTVGSAISTTKFLYDDWHLVCELDASSVLVNSYTWGLDLSETRGGAGGVGGLLWMTDSAGNRYFYSYDGEGNVVALTKHDGTIAALYEYGPFGEPLRASGTMATLNPFRFSTKYTDNQSDLVYYGYRYYNASLGRWISRDPIEEGDSLNLYAALKNNSQEFLDPHGLSTLRGGGLVGAGIGIGLFFGNRGQQLINYNQQIRDNIGSFSRDIIVQDCEIVIAYGHGDTKNPLRWHIAPGCNAGGAVTCYADNNNSAIAQGRNPNFFLPIPRNPNDPVSDGRGGLLAVWGPAFRNNLRISPDKYFVGRLALQQMIADAKERSQELCKKKCCKTIFIRFVRLPSTKEIDDTYIPFQSDIPVKCR